MPPIFISYSRSDREYVLRLTAELARRGYVAWVDEENIPSSSRWWSEITKGIRECSAMIVVMSPDAERSEWVEKELLLARERNKPIFPLLLHGKRFDLFVNIQYTDVTSGELPPEKFFLGLPEEAKKIDEPRTVNSLPDISGREDLYQHVLQRWRVTNSEANETRTGILLGDAGQLDRDGTWEIQTPDPLGRGVYGPYINLQPNKYRVTFRLKINDNGGEDGRIAALDATSRAAHKFFALKTLTVRDFAQSNSFQEFSLLFELFNPDENFEFRIRTNPIFEAKKSLTLDYVELRMREIHGAKQPSVDYGQGQLLTLGDWRLNSDTYQLHIGENVIQLTSTEHRLLRYFMEFHDRALSPSQLLQAIWEYPPNTGDPDLVRAHIRNLRAKIERFRESPIRTVHGIGWMLSVTD